MTGRLTYSSFKVPLNSFPAFSTPLRRSTRRSTRDLDKTHIICSLTPRQKISSISNVFAASPAESLVEQKQPRRSTRNKAKQDVEQKPVPKPKLYLDKISPLADSPATTSDDEAIVSDTESDRSTPKPNLRRLRRSFRESLLAKRATPQSKISESHSPATPKSVRSQTPANSLAANTKSQPATIPVHESLRSRAAESPMPKSSMSQTAASPVPESASSRASISALPESARSPAPASSMLENENASSAKSRTLPSPMPVRSMNHTPINQLPTPATPTQSVKIGAVDVPGKEAVGTPQCSPCSIDCNTPELMKSFYEHSLIINSPSVFSDDIDSPELSAETKLVAKPGVNSSNSADPNTFVITPLELPPSYEEVLHSCRKLDICPEYVFQQPYYSNPADVSKMTEVGFLVLRIPGNKLNDLEPFESCVLNSNQGLAAWRRRQLVSIGGPAMLQRYRNEQQVREYFSSEQRLVMEPAMSPPSRQDAKLWLKARELHKQRQGGKEELHPVGNDVDSPIKVKRQKITMMLNEVEAAGGASGDEDGDLNCSGLTLTPMSQTPQHSGTDKPQLKGTPLSSKMRSKRATKLQFEAARDEQPGSSQSSEKSVSSDAALEALERSSFVRSISSGRNSHELSFGLTNATLDNTFGFKVNLENLQQAKADIEVSE